MGNLIGILGLLLAIVAVAATTNVNDAWANFATWRPWWTMIGIALIALLSAGLGALAAVRWLDRKSSRFARYAPFVVIAKTVHDKLLSWGKIDANDLFVKLNRLEASEDDVWIDDEARHARETFLYHARRALRVREDHEDYRNDIERSETKLYLDNATERLVAALLDRKMPEQFDPYDEGEASWLTGMHWRLKRALWSRRSSPADEL